MANELFRGAEATIVIDNNIVKKIRTTKSYRHEVIDTKLRKARTKRERKVLEKAKVLGIDVPLTFESDDTTTLLMEFIDGKRLRDVLIGHPEYVGLVRTLGTYVARLHEQDIIHGDLTTSNVLHTDDNRIVLIDFGLSFFSKKIEDKAVDIHLLKQAFESTHHKHTVSFFNAFLEGYRDYACHGSVLERLKEVEARGRNKH
ncbi:MAG: KEOPS complex kinase/ATPase Bud32 [Nanoarchaeota archaeon]